MTCRKPMSFNLFKIVLSLVAWWLVTFVSFPSLETNSDLHIKQSCPLSIISLYLNLKSSPIRYHSKQQERPIKVST